MRSERKTSMGWSFAAGALFGGMAVFAPLSSHGTPGPKAEASRPRYVAAASVGGADSPTPLVSDARGPDRLTAAAADSGERRAVNAARTRADAAPTHCELDLQLD